jgi:hypothetical protein
MFDPFRLAMLQEFAADFEPPAAAMLAAALAFRAAVEQYGADARPTASAWYRLFGLVHAVHEPLRLIFDSLLSFLGVEMRFSAGFCGVGPFARKT